ncbi:MAG: VacJ family lipoprotein [Zetaproteobacteria bacterium]|nr:VacJ family lipoprotein [Zetaproteobacteria bacterium]
MRNPYRFLRCLFTAIFLLLSGCATTNNDYDPLEPINRPIDAVNTLIDNYTLKPIAEGYVIITTPTMRNGVTNFFNHWMYLNTILHDLLQGKVVQGSEDVTRFFINTTLGMGGIMDIASKIGYDQHYEDFGQTLAVWGVGEGAYIVYPVLGPNSLRKTPDFITSSITDGMFWLSTVVASTVTMPMYILKYVNVRAGLLSASEMRDELSLDPYVFTREAWRQNRLHLIYDGHPPAISKKDPDAEFDEWADDPQNRENSSTLPNSMPIPTGVFNP